MQTMPLYRGPERRHRNLYVLSNDRAPVTLNLKRWHFPVPRPLTCCWLAMTGGALIAYAVMR
jgi:hypothetical protein